MYLMYYSLGQNHASGLILKFNPSLKQFTLSNPAFSPHPISNLSWFCGRNSRSWSCAHVWFNEHIQNFRVHISHVINSWSMWQVLCLLSLFIEVGVLWKVEQNLLIFFSRSLDRQTLDTTNPRHDKHTIT